MGGRNKHCTNTCNNSHVTGLTASHSGRVNISVSSCDPLHQQKNEKQTQRGEKKENTKRRLFHINTKQCHNHIKCCSKVKKPQCTYGLVSAGPILFVSSLWYHPYLGEGEGEKKLHYLSLYHVSQNPMHNILKGVHAS